MAALTPPTLPPTTNTRKPFPPGCAAVIVFAVVFYPLLGILDETGGEIALVLGVVGAVATYRLLKRHQRATAETIRQNVETARLERERAAAQHEAERRQMLEAEMLRVAAAIAEHTSVLRTKRLQLRRPDEYGIVDEEPWLGHRRYFIDHVLRRQFSQLDPVAAQSLPELIDVVLDDAEKGESGPPILDVHGMDGIAYEHHCADILTAHGWTATVTKASGDQGVDIIARRGHIKVVLQCKRYASPVGNKAVQEVIAARQFEDATHAVVVSTSMYTDSARALAHKARVFLISDTQLPQLWNTLITNA